MIKAVSLFINPVICPVVCSLHLAPALQFLVSVQVTLIAQGTIIIMLILFSALSCGTGSGRCPAVAIKSNWSITE